MTRPFGRRRFVELCTAAAAAAAAHPAAFASIDGVARFYNRVRLVDGAGAPITPGQLEKGRGYVFNYPFDTTPCFLLDLDRPVHHGEPLETRDGAPYVWQGGVGPDESVVGFVAICTHKMSHPSRAISFLNYHAREIEYRDGEDRRARGKDLIFCCSEKSAYDPAQGARVLGGPAPEPLAAVLLEHDAASGAIDALGIYGARQYDEFFEKFGFRLAMENGTDNVRRPAKSVAVVHAAEAYSRQQMSCV